MTQNYYEIQTEDSSPLSPMRFIEIAPLLLKPHPLNSVIYGADDNLSSLIEFIQKSGWIKPLVVTSNMTIISGHRRWAAACELKIKTVPIEILEFPDELSELEALLLENASREKTTEQKVREAKAWFNIETLRAKHRQIDLAGTRPNKTSDLSPNLDKGSKGRTSENVAAKVGMKKSTYIKASKVVDRIDEERLEGKETYQALRKVLNNQSVDAAYKLITSPEMERSAILEKITKGEAKTTTQAQRQLKLERSRNKERLDSTMFFKGNKFTEIAPGQLVEISAPDNPTIHDRTGRIARVDGDWVEVWLRNLELLVMATYRLNISQVTVVPMDKNPELMAAVARIEKLRECDLEPIEIEILNLIDRCVTLTPCELKYLEIIEKQHQI